MAALSLELVGSQEEPSDYSRLAKLADKTSASARAERREILKRNPDVNEQRKLTHLRGF
jgi:hypothetical protein